MRGRTNLPQEVMFIDKALEKPSLEGNFSWTANSVSTANDLQKVIYANGYFVAISTEGAIAYSTTGKDWITRKQFDFIVADIVYENNLYVVIGRYGKYGAIATSTDLLNWTVRKDYLLNSGTMTAFQGIGWTGSTFMLAGIINYDLYLFTTNDFNELTVSSTSCKGYPNPSSDSARDYSYNTKCICKNGKMVIFWNKYGGSSTNNYWSSIVTADGITSSIGGAQSVSSSPNLFEKDGYFFRSYWGNGGNFTQVSINGVNWADIPSLTSLCIGLVSADSFVLGITEKSVSGVIAESYIIANSVSDFISGRMTAISINTVGAKIKSIVAHDKIIVAVGSGGCVFTTIADIPEDKLTFTPDTKDKNYILGDSEKPKVIQVKAVNKNIDANIKPENIKEGISVLGVMGTYKQQV